MQVARKFTHMILVVLALSLIVTACAAPTAAPATAPTTAPGTAATVAPTAAPAASPTSDKPVDIELWATATSTQAPAPPDNWVAFKTIKDKLNINLKYSIIPTGSDGETKLNAAAAANALPDFFETYSAGASGTRNKMVDLVKQGLVSPVDSLLPLMPNRIKTHYDDKTAFALANIDGKQVGFVEKPNLPRREGLVIRKDWLTKLGLKEPTTVDELIAVAKAFTEKDPDGNGKNDTYGIGGYFDGSWGEGQRFAFLFGAYGVPDLWDWDNPNFGLAVRNPNFRLALEKFRDINAAKIIDPDWATINRDEFRIRWPQGRYGIMWEDFSALSSAANYGKFDANFPEGEWVPLPALKATGVSKNYLAAYGQIGNLFVMSKKAGDAGKGPAVAKLLEWMATPEGYYLLGFGVEGVNYKFDKDGVVTTEGLPDPKQAWTDPSTQSLTQMRNQLIFTNEPKEVQARYPSSKSKNGRTISQLAFYQFFSTQPWQDSKPAQIILNPSNRADLQRFYNENFQAFALGSKPLNDQTWGDFLKGLDANVNANKWEADAKKTLQDAGFLKK